MEIFTLVAFEPNVHITLRISDAKAKRMFGDIVMSYSLNALSVSETRLVAKLLVRRTADRKFSWAGPLLPWGDLIMMRKQLLTLKQLSEKTS